MIKTDIILHPHKTILDSFFNTDTSKYLYGKSELSVSETIALGSIIATYHPQRIIRIPEVHIPKRVKTPDFFIDNVRFEVKTPESLSGVKDLANTARKQVKHCGFVVFEFMNAKGAPLCEFINKAFRCCAQHKNVGFILMNHGDIIYSSLR